MKDLYKSFKMAAVSLAVLAVSGSALAVTGAPVGIEEGAIPGAFAHAFTANQLSGQYDEVLTATSASTFATEAIFNASGWFTGATQLPSQLGSFGANGYGLYAKFLGTGTFTVDGSGAVTFTGASGAIQLWADPTQDTVYSIRTSVTGGVPSYSHIDLTSAAGTDSDDILLGTANAITFANGGANGGVGANGNFEVLFNDWSLTTGACAGCGAADAAHNGDKYFTSPRPFYVLLDLNGNFQSFTPTAGNSVQLLNNSANAFFNPTLVPEPGALALVAVALLGVGAATRRARKS